MHSLGYRVLSAANGREALEIWAQSRTEIDLLLTDVVMPESISGRDLAHKLIMDKPDLKVIFTSGYSAELIGPEFEQEKEHGFLSKPYLTDRLAKIVAAQLARPVRRPDIFVARSVANYPAPIGRTEHLPRHPLMR